MLKCSVSIYLQNLVERGFRTSAGGQTKGLKTGRAYHTAKKKAGNPEHFLGSPNKSLGCKIQGGWQVCAKSVKKFEEVDTPNSLI